MHPNRHSLVFRFIGIALGLSFFLGSSFMPASVVAQVDQTQPALILWGPDPLFLQNYSDSYAYARALKLEPRVNTSDVVKPVLMSQDLPPVRRYRIAPRRL